VGCVEMSCERLVWHIVPWIGFCQGGGGWGVLRPGLNVIFHYSGERGPGTGGKRGGVQVGEKRGEGHGPIGTCHGAEHALALVAGQGASTS